jgi:MFS family permease
VVRLLLLRHSGGPRVGPQFFPSVSPAVGTLAALGPFAVGFVARPLGGAVMGHLADRVGRKRMLVVSLALMGLATFCIACGPRLQPCANPRRNHDVLMLVNPALDGIKDSDIQR